MKDVVHGEETGMSLMKSRSKSLRGAVVLGTALACVLGTTAAQARTKWVVHDGGTITGVATTVIGGDFDVCDDGIRGLAGWSSTVSPGQDPTTFPIPSSALGTVGYEIFSGPPGVDLFVDDTGSEPRIGWLDSGGDFHEADLAASFTTQERQAPDPIEIGTDWYVFTTAPFSKRLNGVSPGDTIGVKPHPGSALATVADFDAVDCGDRGFLSWWERDRDFCQTGQVLAGDVTGDGRADLVCRARSGGGVAVATAGPRGAFLPTFTEGTGPGLCRQSGTDLLLADTDGNGRADLICHREDKGKVAVALARKDGHFAGSDWSGTKSVCRGKANQLVAGDVNGDGRADLVCHQPGTGGKQVALATGKGRYPDIDWKGGSGFCKNAAVRIGDLDGDGRADLLCHKASGANAMSTASAKGRFGKADWSGTLSKCAGTFEVSVARANSDKRADLICHNPTSGVVRIAFAGKGGKLPKIDFSRKAAACTEPTSQLLVADSSGDKQADLICHQADTGYLSVFFSDL